jgi:hypothetical protein
MISYSLHHFVEERVIILFTLLKQRDELCAPIIIGSQFNPKTWNWYLGTSENYSIPDGIGRSLID